VAAAAEMAAQMGRQQTLSRGVVVVVAEQRVHPPEMALRVETVELGGRMLLQTMEEAAVVDSGG
jgi:hypothetical protein